MIYTVMDCESDGLLETVTRIHCICYTIFDTDSGIVESGELTDYEEMKKFLQMDITRVCHNLIRYDKPLFKKILGVDIQGTLIDTLPLSWSLYPLRKKHGLELWGEELGVKKPEITDWNTLTTKEYVHRCNEDVKINVLLFEKEMTYLKELYEGNISEISRFMAYTTFKIECAREAEEEKWLVDVEHINNTLPDLKKIQEEKSEALKSVMPDHVIYKKISKPKIMTKKDGSYSEAGNRWLSRLIELGLPEDTEGPLKVEDYREPPKVASAQLKAWLFSLGWVPQYYKPAKSKVTGKVTRVPQIGLADGAGICPSVKDLYEKAPELAHIEGLYVVQHRIGILEGFLRDKDKDNYLKAEISGFTNTLRFKHTTIVNLPQIPKPYWKEIRGSLIAPEGYVLCGSDMSGLEDNTKQHYMMFFDPDYVIEMRTPGFDSHMDIAVLAKAISRDDEGFYKYYAAKKDGNPFEYSRKESWGDPMANSATDLTYEQMLALDSKEQSRIVNEVLKAIRLKNKKVNFAAVYGAYPPKIAETAKISIFEAQKLFDTYWQRNDAVKQVAENAIWKTVNGQMWVFNPVSRFWYSLRFEKDIFSTLNQGTGVYCFDTWVSLVRAKGIRICGQFHDEIIFRLRPENQERAKQALTECIKQANEILKLNVPLAISIDFGHRYSDIH